MKIQTLNQAIKEATLFIEAAKKVPAETIIGEGKMAGKSWEVICEPSKESATCKRASMDLTRVLADLRQNR